MRNGTTSYYLVLFTGDPQTALSHLGDVVLFVQYALVKFKASCPPMICSFLPLSSTLNLNSSSKHTNSQKTTEQYPQRHLQTWNCTCVRMGGVQRIYQRIRHGRRLCLTVEAKGSRIIFYGWSLIYFYFFMINWVTILYVTQSTNHPSRGTKPKILLRIAIPLVSQAITASTSMHKFDKEVLMNGIAYFTGPLLNWVLVGVVKYLIREMQRGWVFLWFFPFFSQNSPRICVVSLGCMTRVPHHQLLFRGCTAFGNYLTRVHVEIGLHVLASDTLWRQMSYHVASDSSTREEIGEAVSVYAISVFQPSYISF